jgi:hypothetical protein
MNTTLIPISLQDVFTKNISAYLYKDNINNLYGTCKDMREQLDRSCTYIYTRICLHYQPHSVDDLPVIDSYGCQYWYKEGKLHRDGDLPAEIRSDGDRFWWKEGRRHRDGDLPAVICSNGNQLWFKEGKLHRDGDLPAMILSNGRTRRGTTD